VDVSLFGFLTVLVAVLGLVFVACAFVFITRLEHRTPASLSEELGTHKAVLRKLRKGESMSQDELDYAAQIVDDCRSPLAYTMPAAIFTFGCFYVFGCLQQLHGGTPTVRTFIGVLPMFGATNMSVQLRRVARLKGRLQKVSMA
jgi:hypothetical protein